MNTLEDRIGDILIEYLNDLEEDDWIKLFLIYFKLVIIYTLNSNNIFFKIIQILT